MCSALGLGFLPLITSILFSLAVRACVGLPSFRPSKESFLVQPSDKADAIFHIAKRCRRSAKVTSNKQILQAFQFTPFRNPAETIKFAPRVRGSLDSMAETLVCGNLVQRWREGMSSR
jgi:hypothetical protein